MVMGVLEQGMDCVLESEHKLGLGLIWDKERCFILIIRDVFFDNVCLYVCDSTL